MDEELIHDDPKKLIHNDSTSTLQYNGYTLKYKFDTLSNRFVCTTVLLTKLENIQIVARNIKKLKELFIDVVDDDIADDLILRVICDKPIYNMVLCGDIHGNISKFSSLVRAANRQNYHLVQLGDMGGDYGKLYELGSNFSWFPGNHEIFPFCYSQPNCLGKFGPHYLDSNIFFVAGAFSIDRKHRTPGLNWFPEEELTVKELEKAISLCCERRPKVLLCHEPPRVFGNKIGNEVMLQNYGFNPAKFSTKTSLALQQIVDTCDSIESVYCAHFHMSATHHINNVRFQCLDIEQITII